MIEHTRACDQQALGAIVQQILPDWETTPRQLMDTLRVLRAKPSPAMQIPPCECARLQLARLTTGINTARKAGDTERYEALLDERRLLRHYLREELAKAGATA